MEEKDKLEYVKRCKGIRYWLMRAYTDYGVLNAMSVHNHAVANGKIDRCPNMIYEHICELAKMDMVLCLWKAYCDDSFGSTNTIKHLHAFLFSKELKYTVKLGLSKEIAPVEKQIRDARHKFLAHDDITGESVKVNMELAEKALDEIVVMYNGLCDKSIDDRVEQISVGNIGAITITSTHQMISLMQSSSTAKE